MPDPRVHALVREAIIDANEDIPAVLHILWQANSWYPELAASERLALAEQAIRQILDDELVVLIRNRDIDHEGDEVPPDEYDSLLRRWDTWAVLSPDGGVTLYYRRPDAVDYIPVPPPRA